MLSPRWRKVLRDLLGNRTRTVLVVLSIAVGVFAIGMIGGTQSILTQDLRRSYLASNPASATVYCDRFDDSLLESIRSMREISWAEGRQNLTVQVRSASGQMRQVVLGTVSDYDDIRIQKSTRESGKYAPGDRELVLERASLDYLGLGVGDIAEVRLSNGKTRNLRIVGTVHDISKLPSIFAGTGYGFIAGSTLEWLGAYQGYNQLVFTVAENANDKEYVKQVAEAVRNRVEKNGKTVWWTSVPDPGKHPVDDIFQTMIYLLGTLGLVALLLSGFLVVNTISALLTQQRRQIGVMKAIGARAGQIVGMYLVTVLAFGALSLFVGIPLGSLGAYAMGSFIAGIVNVKMSSFGPTTHVFAMQVAVGLGVPLLAALWPVVGGVRITAREAMSAHGTGKATFGRGFVDYLLERVRGLSRPMLLSLRNTFRRKGRLALTLATLTLGGATFIAVFSVRESTVVTLDEALAYFNYDFQVGFQRSYRSDYLIQEALRVPGVAAAESLVGTNLRPRQPDGTEGDTLSVLALRADTEMIKPQLLAGRWLLPEDDNAVVINTVVLQREPGLAVGSRLTLTGDERETDWLVVGIVRGVMTGPIVYANQPYFERALRAVGHTGQIWVMTQRHDPLSRSSVSKALGEHFKAEGIKVGSIRSQSEERERAQSQFDLIVYFLLIMALLMAVVGGLGLMGTMSLNVLERTREIGVMRAIGASDGSVRQVFLVEGILIGVISWLVGAILAVPISQLLSLSVGQSLLQSPLTYAYSFTGTAIWLLVVIFLSILASILPARSASRLSIREVLAYE